MLFYSLKARLALPSFVNVLRIVVRYNLKPLNEIITSRKRFGDTDVLNLHYKAHNILKTMHSIVFLGSSELQNVYIRTIWRHSFSYIATTSLYISS